MKHLLTALIAALVLAFAVPVAVQNAAAAGKDEVQQPSGALDNTLNAPAKKPMGMHAPAKAAPMHHEHHKHHAHGAKTNEATKTNKDAGKDKHKHEHDKHKSEKPETGAKE